MRTAAVKGEMNMAQKVQKVRSKLEKKGYSGIECTEVGKCIRLEGEMTEWTDIVKAGKAAAKFGYKGVLNDISLKGFTEPAIRAPKFTDGSLEGAQPDVLIIGGGVIGCSIARELTRYKLNVLLVDKESDVAMQASSRNDGMIHPGIASHVGTKRGEMNVRGNAMYTQVCKELSVPFERWSNLILYSEKIFGFFSPLVFNYREKHLGIEGRKISREELHRIEPNITDEAIGAFEFPSSGVLNSCVRGERSRKRCKGLARYDCNFNRYRG